MRIILILLLAFLAFGFWYGEVRFVKGWKGLNWLGGYPWSAVPICLLIALAAWIGAASRKRGNAVQFIAFPILAWGLLLVCFEIAKASLFALASPRFLLYQPDLLRQGSLLDRLRELSLLLGVPLAILLASLGLWLLARLFLQRMSWWTLLFLLLGLVLIIPASLVTIHLLPAINGQTDDIHAVKMGYPAFWAVVLVGAAVMLGRKITKEVK